MPPKKTTNGDSEDNRSRSSLSTEIIDPNNESKWEQNESVIRKQWLDNLQHVLIFLQFFNDTIKEKEATVGWWIILITSFISFMTLFDLEQLGTNDNFNNNYNWTKSVTLSGLSMTTTLLAAWAKKKGFVKRIKDIDKRVFSIEALGGRISSVLDLPIEDRPQYITFYRNNITEVQDLLCYNQLISPTELNFVLYIITKNYPTLVKDVYPWYIQDPETKIYTPDYHFGKNIIASYEKQMFNSIIYRIFSCFFCQSKCCKNIDDGNPWTSPHESENSNDSEFHKELGKYTTPPQNIKKNIKNKTAENIVINIDS